jgi:hypothetical protein
MPDSPVTYAAVPDIVGIQIVRIVNGRGSTILRMQSESEAVLRRAIAAILAAFEADQAALDAETVAGLPEEYR